MVNIEEFLREREALNELLQRESNLEIKRFLSLDSQIYRQGALAKSTKELIGLVASLVLRCGDCINWHLEQCREAGITDDELREALAIGLIVGGSITIPHLRRAVSTWNEFKQHKSD